MTITLDGRRARTPTTTDSPAAEADRCEVCGITGPLGLQQVGDDPAATFLLCARCGAPAVNRGMARWLS